MGDVLALNSNYQAVNIIGWRKAMSMIFTGTAEVIYIDSANKYWHNLKFMDWAELSKLKAEFEPDDYKFIRTIDLKIAVPRIIRILGYDKLPRHDVKFNRQNIFARDNRKCQYCGNKLPTDELSLDHVVPKTQGGKTTWDNIVCACLKCNIKKGGRTPEQARMKLITVPVKPKRNPVISVRIRDPKYVSWQQFLDEAYWTVDLE